jgi:predicted transcriptional regulator
MAKKPRITDLTRRERQIMDIIYKQGRATAVDVVNNLPGEPVNATVRSMLGVLEEKGYLSHDRVKGKFYYYPTIPVEQARNTALDHLMNTLFKGSEARAVISILKKSDSRLSNEERQMILDIIEESREEGR